MRYFRVGSLAWHSGAAMIVVGVLSAIFPDAEELTGLTGVVGALFGGLTHAASPIELIGMGAAIIGIRDKQERG